MTARSTAGLVRYSQNRPFTSSSSNSVLRRTLRCSETLAGASNDNAARSPALRGSSRQASRMRRRSACDRARSASLSPSSLMVGAARDERHSVPGRIEDLRLDDPAVVGWRHDDGSAQARNSLE